MAVKHTSPDTEHSRLDSPDTEPVHWSPEIPRRPEWLDRVEDIVGTDTPDLIYRDEDNSLHIVSTITEDLGTRKMR
jgi:hypothetical protein